MTEFDLIVTRCRGAAAGVRIEDRCCALAERRPAEASLKKPIERTTFVAAVGMDVQPSTGIAASVSSFRAAAGLRASPDYFTRWF